MDEIPDVLCINCENMIEITKLEAHSKICIQPTQQVLKYNNMSFLPGLHFRLIKLKSSVEALVYYENESLSSSTKGYLEFLIVKANELLSLHNDNMESVNIATAINTKLRNVSGKMPCKYVVYSERLRFLALEKTYFILDVISKKTERISISQMLIAKKQEMDYTKKHMKFIKRAKNRIGNRTNSYDNLEEVSSNIIPRSSIMSNIESPGQRKGNGVIEIEDFQPLSSGGRQKVVNIKSDMKKSFFSKCLVVKLTFHSKHPAQYIQINELYEKILENNTPAEKWEEFIRDEFDHPERWVNLTVIPRFDAGDDNST
ncbi:hypothetical protein SteCoe_5714 [Stentor coeruleus]|uniref:Uncharacterized protein n=1 Tax=Stentor coeruleus TaxID=5963 RepID=A0A1R2CRR9_9CILI|nr:hypothetical protein SteCoe_5714 [Stentor coeruleus]